MYFCKQTTGFNKNNLSFLAILSAAVLSLQTARAVPLNLGFETGDFSSWTVSVPSGTSEFSGLQPAGSAGVVSTWGPYTGMASAMTAHDGTYFAAIGSAAYGYFTGAQTYNITARLSLNLRAGQVVSGWAAFYNGDYNAQDMARVRIFDASNNELATPWEAVSGGVSYESVSPWQSWQWQAPTGGSFTLELGVTTSGDDSFASYGLFDNISMATVMPVPEPSGMVMASLGVVCLAGCNRMRRK